MLFRLVLLFVLTPLVELALLLKFADATDWKIALLMVIVTGLVGSWLLKTQAGRCFCEMRDDLAAGRMPTDSLLDALMIAVAGGLLLTPGMLTDLLAMTMLIPYCRKRYREWLVRWFRSRFQIRTNFTAGRSQVIDSHVVRDEEDDGRKRLDD